MNETVYLAGSRHPAAGTRRAAVERRRSEIRRRLAQDLVGSPQHPHLALEVLDALPFVRRRPRSLAAVARTHFRSVSAVQPSFAAMAQMAAHSDGCSPRASRTRRTARSRDLR